MTEVECKLLDAIRATEWGAGANVSDIERPDFIHCSRFEWPANVPEPMRAMWDRLSVESKLAVFSAAAQMAHYDDPPVA